MEDLSYVFPSAKTLEFFTFFEITELSIGVCIVLAMIVAIISTQILRVSKPSSVFTGSSIGLSLSSKTGSR